MLAVIQRNHKGKLEKEKWGSISTLPAGMGVLMRSKPKKNGVGGGVSKSISPWGKGKNGSLGRLDSQNPYFQARVQKKKFKKMDNKGPERKRLWHSNGRTYSGGNVMGETPPTDAGDTSQVEKKERGCDKRKEGGVAGRRV